MRALIVDDSAVMRKVLQRALADPLLQLVDIVEATNGHDALHLLRGIKEREESLDLILCDVNMPVMDGLSFLEEAQKESLAQGVPAIVITTESSEKTVMRAVAAGARGYICKPFTAEQVRCRILPLLSKPAAQAA